MQRPTLIQRAIELAGTGSFDRLDHIEKLLTKEGYTDVCSHLSAPSLRKQLRQVAANARDAIDSTGSSSRQKK